MGQRQLLHRDQLSSFSSAKALMPQNGSVFRSENQCFSTQTLKVQWNKQTIKSLVYRPVCCGICCESAGVMSRLMQGSDIGYFSVLYHQLLQYLHFQEPMEVPLASLQRPTLAESDCLCILRPWQVLQDIICKRLVAEPGFSRQVRELAQP